MIFAKNNIIVDLGTGEFRVKRFVKTLVNKYSELPTAIGDHDRAFLGNDVIYLLEGDYDAVQDAEFFDELTDHLKHSNIGALKIDGRSVPTLAPIKLVMTRTDDSFVGSFSIMLKEI